MVHAELYVQAVLKQHKPALLFGASSGWSAKAKAKDVSFVQSNRSDPLVKGFAEEWGGWVGGLAWLGLAWLGLAWLGLAWLGKVGWWVGRLVGGLMG